jgi:hypothetical protein
LLNLPPQKRAEYHEAAPMFLSKALILGASLYSCALAQTKIAFTQVPAVVVAGESYKSVVNSEERGNLS